MVNVQIWGGCGWGLGCGSGCCFVWGSVFGSRRGVSGMGGVGDGFILSCGFGGLDMLGCLSILGMVRFASQKRTLR